MLHKLRCFNDLKAATPGDQTVNQPSLAQMSPSAGMTREKPKRAPTEANEPSRRTRHRREDVPRETDPKRLKSRSKQIEFGKNTIGYNAYRARVPKYAVHVYFELRRWREKRKRFTDPVTPDIYQVCSKRSWDGQVFPASFFCVLTNLCRYRNGGASYIIMTQNELRMKRRPWRLKGQVRRRTPSSGKVFFSGILIYHFCVWCLCENRPFYCSECF